MSCWVVPSVAAELWGCSVDAVKSAIKNGSVASRDEAGWTFVDVAPDSPALTTPKSIHPATFTSQVLSQAEKDALIEPPAASVAALEQAISEERQMTGDWRVVRKNVSSMRRPPLMKKAA
jgi:hypothetical protein